MRIVHLGLLSVVLTVTGYAQDFTRDLTSDEMLATGIARLSPGELDALKAVVERYKKSGLSKATPAETKTDKERNWVSALITSQKAVHDAPEMMEGRLVGAVATFEGRRKFVLENGQEWQMIENGSYAGPTYQNPKVVLRPGMMGVVWLTIPEASLRVKVKPIKLE